VNKMKLMPSKKAYEKFRLRAPSHIHAIILS
jgi:hypothetical protein